MITTFSAIATKLHLPTRWTPCWPSSPSASFSGCASARRRRRRRWPTRRAATTGSTVRHAGGLGEQDSMPLPSPPHRCQPLGRKMRRPWRRRCSRPAASAKPCRRYCGRAWLTMWRTTATAGDDACGGADPGGDGSCFGQTN